MTIAMCSCVYPNKFDCHEAFFSSLLQDYFDQGEF